MDFVLALLKEIVNWTGWAPVALVAIGAIPATIYILSREISIRDQRIGGLKDEIENSRAYQYDQIYERLTNRVKTLNEELDVNISATGEKQEEIKQIQNELAIAHAEIRNLQLKLRRFDEELGDLLEDDYCQICEPDDDHPGANFIDWTGSKSFLSGDTDIVEKVGYCNWCSSPQVKCQICGSVTSIDLDVEGDFECTGGCGTLYIVEIWAGNKSLDHQIRVSRLPVDLDD